MRAKGRTSTIRVRSKKSAVEIDLSTEPISDTVLALAVIPAVFSLFAAVLAYHLHVLSISIGLVALTVACFVFFLAIASVHLQAKQKLIVSRDGVKELSYTLVGPRTTVFTSKKILALKALIEGWEQVQICLQMSGNTKRTLFTSPIDNLDQYTQCITDVLDKHYIATALCTRVISHPFEKPADKPDFLSFDVTSKILICEMPDNRQIEVPFADIVSIDALGQRESTSPLDEDPSALEYVCEPIVCLNNGTIYVLQRFLSTESGLTNDSRAYINASKTVDYLRKFVN